MNKTDEAAWTFLEELSEKTMQWESFDTSKNATVTPAAPTLASRSGLHVVDASIATEARLAAVLRRIEDLEEKGASQVESTRIKPANQASTSGCGFCHSPQHVSDEFHLLSEPYQQLEQMNAAFQRPPYDPWS